VTTSEGGAVEIADPPGNEPPGGRSAAPDAPAAPYLPDAAPKPPPPWLDAAHLALRIVGGLVAVAAAAVTALAEIFFAPLRVGGVLIGASVVFAVVANVAIVYFTVAATGARWPALVPPVVWFALMLLASGRRGEGDLLLTSNNWVGLVTIFAGSLAFAGAGYRLIQSRPVGVGRRGS
jgi:hypothetical protein